MRLRRRPQISRGQQLMGVVGTLLVIAVVWALASLLAPAGRPVGGQATAVDGDTLRIGRERIRLVGLDAPELDQPCTDSNGIRWACGWEARAYLTGILRDGETTCAPTGRDRYLRLLAHCRTGNGADLGEAIVAAGWAIATDFEYAAAGQAARAAGRGILAGSFEEPAGWRRDHGEAGFNLWDWLRGWFGY